MESGLRRIEPFYSHRFLNAVSVSQSYADACHICEGGQSGSPGLNLAGTSSVAAVEIGRMLRC